MALNLDKLKFWKVLNPMWLVFFLLLVFLWQNRWKLVAVEVGSGDSADVYVYKLDRFTGNVYWTINTGRWGGSGTEIREGWVKISNTTLQRRR